MTLKATPEQLWKQEHYHEKINQHKKCEARPLFGNELWKHIKKCEVSIPEPRITPRSRKK